LRQLSGFFWYSVSTTNQNDHHDITEVLLKVALNTINQTKPLFLFFSGMHLGYNSAVTIQTSTGCQIVLIREEGIENVLNKVNKWLRWMQHDTTTANR